MPSLWVEGFGMAVVDAMLRGIPVLASNYGGLAEAKLGTDYLLPVHPIQRFEDYLDENMLPVPVVPEQDVGPGGKRLPACSRIALYMSGNRLRLMTPHGDSSPASASNLLKIFYFASRQNRRPGRRQFLGGVETPKRPGAEEADTASKSRGYRRSHIQNSKRS